MKCISILILVLLVVVCKVSAKIQLQLRSKPSSPFSKHDETLEKLMLMRGGSVGSHDGDVDWRYFLAGGICAACSHGITTPLDVIKTKMQTNPEKYNKGMLHAARDIVTTDGLGVLLAGLGPTVIGYGFEGSLKFGFYETFKKVFAHLTPNAFVNLLLASVVAGAVASIVLCPMEEARIKMVGDASWAKENTASAIARMVREDGLLASFGGLSAMLSKQIPYTMGKQVSFDLFAVLLYTFASKFDTKNMDMKWIISTGAAFLASIVACLSSQPGDMILTATYKGKGDAGRGFLPIIRSIYAKHGLGGFFLGVQARLAHVASIITTQLVIYDMVKLSLGLPVTGSH